MNEPVLARLNNLMHLREEVEHLEVAFPWEPAADWLDQGTHLVLVMDLPGLLPDHLELREDGDELTMAGERHLDIPGELLSRERPGDSFSRTLRFPDAVIPGSGQATLSGGVLNVRFEKRRKTLLQLEAGNKED
ncbi:Hsp20/alpha crystallin family protein [Deinococcus sp.]|uniref:Hsp20/alpha crystallin family protein n=1 Tax=Deinococcus sp. TaxID=47478 RepID=UPI003CC5D783